MAINKDHLTAEQIQVTQFCGQSLHFLENFLMKKELGIMYAQFAKKYYLIRQQSMNQAQDGQVFLMQLQKK
jgi:hypothetical protein